MSQIRDAFICAGTRTPIGRYGGALSAVRPDDLAAHTVAAALAQVPELDPQAIADVILGNANQAGEDNRNIARMAVLLAGLPPSVPGTTINRLCGSGMDATAQAARQIKVGEADIMLAGGAESMSRAPFVMPKATTAFSRTAEIYDTTIGWRFINKALAKVYGTDSMPETAENVAQRWDVSRQAQDAFALESQRRAAAAQANGRLAQEITPVTIPQRKGDPVVVDRDEHPRETTLEKLAQLPTPFREGGSVTAGNASGVNDGAAVLVLASEQGIKDHGLTPKARIVAATAVGVEPAVMGIGPLPAAQKVLSMAGLSVQDMDVVELNEAFAAQAIPVLQGLGLPTDAAHVNPNGGAIALGHPLGMSGARLILTATHELAARGGRYGLCCMCIGVGQGIAMIIENVQR